MMSDSFDPNATAAADETGAMTPSDASAAMAAPDPYAASSGPSDVVPITPENLGAAAPITQSADPTVIPPWLMGLGIPADPTLLGAGNQNIVNTNSGASGGGTTATPGFIGQMLAYVQNKIGWNTHSADKDPQKNDFQKFALLGLAGAASGISASYTASKARAIQQQEADTQRAQVQGQLALAQARLNNQAAMAGMKVGSPTTNTGLLYNPAALTPLAQRKTT